MPTRYKILDKDGGEVLDIAIGEAFTLAGRKYPKNWLRLGAGVPLDFLVEQYETPPPPRVITTTPRNITKLQLVRAMRLSGIWTSVRKAISQSPTSTKEDWEFATVIAREDDLVSSLGAGVGLTPADMDTLFMEASTL